MVLQELSGSENLLSSKELKYAHRNDVTEKKIRVNNINCSVFLTIASVFLDAVSFERICNMKTLQKEFIHSQSKSLLYQAAVFGAEWRFTF